MRQNNLPPLLHPPKAGGQLGDQWIVIPEIVGVVVWTSYEKKAPPCMERLHKEHCSCLSLFVWKIKKNCLFVVFVIFICVIIWNHICMKGRKGQGLSKWPDSESQTSIYSWKLRAAPAGQRVNLECIFKPWTKFNSFLNTCIHVYMDRVKF